jgi:hypothetical protein
MRKIYANYSVAEFNMWALPAAGPFAHTAQGVTLRPVSATVPNALSEPEFFTFCLFLRGVQEGYAVYRIKELE